MFSKLRPVVAFTALLLTGCVAALYMPSETDALRSGTPLDTLIAGRKLYINHCGSCHNLYLPEQYTLPEWTQIADSMQERSKLDGHEKNMIIKYLGTKAKS